MMAATNVENEVCVRLASLPVCACCTNQSLGWSNEETAPVARLSMRTEYLPLPRYPGTYRNSPLPCGCYLVVLAFCSSSCSSSCSCHFWTRFRWACREVRHLALARQFREMTPACLDSLYLTRRARGQLTVCTCPTGQCGRV